jgi:hypothetical protein
MEVDALASDYTILAAGMSYNSNESRYSFFQLNTRAIKKKEIGFHLKYPVLIRKTISLALRLIYFRSLNVAKFDFRKDFKHLKKKDFHLIIVHHFLDLPLAVKLANHKNVKVIFNAHEYYPLEFDNEAAWMASTHLTYMEIAKSYLKNVSICFCVGEQIAQKYKQEFGLDSIVITNAKEFYDLSPIELTNHQKIKLIHHGAAINSRRIELMFEVMNLLGDNYSLDLILIIGSVECLNELMEKGKNISNISFIPEVATKEIPIYTNKYDIGLFLLPPTNFNYKNALPNKLFEFIQARLAIAIGPSPEMASLVNKYDLGVVSEEFSPESLAGKIKELTIEKIMYYKKQCHKYAKELSVEENWKKIHETVDQLIN